MLKSKAGEHHTAPFCGFGFAEINKLTDVEINMLANAEINKLTLILKY